MKREGHYIPGERTGNPYKLYSLIMRGVTQEKIRRATHEYLA